MNVPRRGLSDEQWIRLKPLLPPQKPKTGRPNKDHRIVLHGILWIHRTGAPWRDLPQKFGFWKTVYSRFYRWSLAGIWDNILQMLLVFAHEQGLIDWSLNHIDSTTIRAHQHAAGARTFGPDGEPRSPESLALGRSRGGFGTKVHLRVDANGKVLFFKLTSGQTHDVKAFIDLMEGVNVKKRGPGRLLYRPKKVVGDKGYNAGWVRTWLAERGIGRVIPRRDNERRRGPFNTSDYKKRARVECTIGRAKQNRRLATRYEKLDTTYHAMWLIAAIVSWL